MKVIIAPDKFKGSLTSFEACEAIAAGIRAAGGRMDILQFPMADGGDGFSAVMKHYLHTDTVPCLAEDPLGRPVKASYELKDEVAIVDVASASGLVLLKEGERNALLTSTYGTGVMIREAISAGAGKIILGLGGSATNDAGTGILAALGFQFFDKGGQILKPCGGNLANIHRIVPPGNLPDIRFDIACDVQNTLYGEQGAAHVYAPQKGASPEDVRLLDAGLRHFADLLGNDVADIPGTGAAGGIAAGLMGFFDVKLSKGIEWVISTSRIRDAVTGSSLVITGEGRIDNQSLYGKVVSDIAAIAASCNIPAIAFCGINDAEETELAALQLRSVTSIATAGADRRYAMQHAAQLLTDAVQSVFLSSYATDHNQHPLSGRRP